MPSVTLVKDVVWRVSSRLKDANPQFVGWTEAEHIADLIDAQTTLARFLQSSMSRIDSIKLAAGTRQSIANIAAADCKPGDGTTPVAPIRGIQVLGVSCNMGSTGTARGKIIRGPIDRKTLDAQNPNWQSQVDTAASCWMFDPTSPTSFYVSPGATAGIWAEVEYSALPLAIPAAGTPGSPVYHYAGSSTTVITVPDEYVTELVDYMLAMAHLKQAKYADKKEALFYGSKFAGSLTAKVKALTGANPNFGRWPWQPEPIGAAA